MRLGDCRSCSVIPSEARNLTVEAWITQITRRDQRAYMRSLTPLGMTARMLACFIAVASIGFVTNCFAAKAGPAIGFHYYRDTLAFANTTVFAYEQGKIVSHHNF